MTVAVNEDLEEQRPEKQSLCRSLRRDSHVKCLILTLLILACFAVLIWCSCAQVTRVVVNFKSFPITTRRRVSPCDEGYLYIPVAFLTMLYLVYLVECWHCSTRLELAYKVDASTVYEHIQKMRETQPVIWWKAVCYHYVRRTRHVTRYRNGDAYSTTQVYYERVNSHGAGSSFSYMNCGVKDISKKLLDLEKHPATKIRFSKGFAFANLEAANEFDEQRRRFFHENERLDDYMEMCEGLDLVGVNFQEHMVAFADREKLPWYVSHMVFWILSMLLMSWPLRVLIQYKTAYVHYQVNKLFGVNYTTPSSEALTVVGPMSRGTTSDSSEFERHIVNNNTIAPSYSEALLLAPSTCSRNEAGSNANITAPFTQSRSVTFSSRPQIEAIDGPIQERSTNKRCSWAGTSRRPSIPRTGLPVSITQSSLRNGRVIYHVSPLPVNEDVTGRTTELVQSNSGIITTRLSPESQQPPPPPPPPSYDEALRQSRPLFLPLRRSITDRDIQRRLPTVTLPTVSMESRTLGDVEEDRTPMSVDSGS